MATIMDRIPVQSVDVGAEAAEGLSKGFSTGLDWAAKRMQFENQKQQLEMQRKQHEEESKKFQWMYLDKFTSDLEAAAQTVSPRLRKALIKRAEMGSQAVGVKLDPTLIEALNDVPSAQETVRALRLAQKFQGTDVGDQMAAKAINALGDEQWYKYQKDFLNNEAELQKALINFEGRQKEKKEDREFQREMFGRKTEAAKEARKDKQTNDLAKIAKVNEGKTQRQGVAQANIDKKFNYQVVKDLKASTEKIDKEFSPVISTLRRIEETAKSGLKNPQSRVALVRLAQPLSELKASVVRESEFKTVSDATSVLNRIHAKFKSIEDGNKIPVQVANDIVRYAKVIAGSVNKERAARLKGVIQGIDNNSLDVNKAQEILGQNYSLFRNKYEGGRTSPVKGASLPGTTPKPSTPVNINNILTRAAQLTKRALTPEEVNKLKVRFGGQNGVQKQPANPAPVTKRLR